MLAIPFIIYRKIVRSHKFYWITLFSCKLAIKCINFIFYSVEWDGDNTDARAGEGDWNVGAIVIQDGCYCWNGNVPKMRESLVQGKFDVCFFNTIKIANFVFYTPLFRRKNRGILIWVRPSVCPSHFVSVL